MGSRTAASPLTNLNRIGGCTHMLDNLHVGRPPCCPQDCAVCRTSGGEFRMTTTGATRNAQHRYTQPSPLACASEHFHKCEGNLHISCHTVKVSAVARTSVTIQNGGLPKCRSIHQREGQTLLGRLFQPQRRIHKWTSHLQLPTYPHGPTEICAQPQAGELFAIGDHCATLVSWYLGKKTESKPAPLD
jgi:hypothetical protein